MFRLLSKSICVANRQSYLWGELRAWLGMQTDEKFDCVIAVR